MENQDYQTVEEFEFRGTAGQWFGIWIVNLLLTIVTLGIYSAWAKVRRNKYFYQHTYVAGRNFDYHATGMQIFIGRLIVIGAVVAYSIFSAVNPLIAGIMLLVLFAIFPILIVRSLKFNAQMSSWSNVRFGFRGTNGQSYLVYLVYPILTALTLYLTYPFLDRAMKRFTMGNLNLGQSEFEFDAPIRPFYGAFLAAFAWILFVGIICLTVFGSALAGFNMEALANLENDPQAAGMVVFGFYAFIFLALFPAGTIYQAFVRNIAYNHLVLEGDHQFYSNVHPVKLFWIALSNAVLMLISLGLLLPYAQVRMTKYLASHTALIPNGSLDNFLGSVDRQSSALGDAYTDIEAIDVGLPI